MYVYMWCRHSVSFARTFLKNKSPQNTAASILNSAPPVSEQSVPRQLIDHVFGVGNPDVTESIWGRDAFRVRVGGICLSVYMFIHIYMFMYICMYISASPYIYI